MGEKIQGVVKKIYKKGRTYSLLVNEEWYGNGFSVPECEEGNLVEFEFKRNGRWLNIDRGSIKVLETGPSFEEKKGSSSNKEYITKLSRDDYWSRKEERDLITQKAIQWQASRNAAIELVRVLVDPNVGGLVLPKIVAKKADAVLAAVAHYTEVFNSETSDLGTDPNRVAIPDNNEEENEEENSANSEGGYE